MLTIVGQNFEVKIIDIFNGDHTKDEFLQINPSSTLPVIVDGSFKVLGSTQVFVNYLANAKPKLQKLYPTEKKAEIQSHLNWLVSVLRPSTKRLTSMIVGQKAFDQPESSASDLNEEIEFFYGTLLPKLNDMLGDRPYFCDSQTLSVVDIVIYNELLSVIAIIGRKVDPGTKLAKWIKLVQT